MIKTTPEYTKVLRVIALILLAPVITLGFILYLPTLGWSNKLVDTLLKKVWPHWKNHP